MSDEFRAASPHLSTMMSHPLKTGNLPLWQLLFSQNLPDAEIAEMMDMALNDKPALARLIESGVVVCDARSQFSGWIGEGVG